MEYIVNTLQDQNDGDANGTSLRDAINAANSNPGDDVIKFDSSLNGNTIGLTLGALQITDNLTVTGDSTNLVTISGLGKSGVFGVNRGANVTLNRLKIVNGYGESGGGIDNRENLTIINSSISNNRTYSTGGGIYNRGHLNLINSSVYGNSTSGTGGGISNIGTATVLNSTISGNTASTGGGIYNSGSDKISIFDTTITNNSASSGGGIANYGSGSTTTELANTIVAGNIGTDVDFSDTNVFASLNGNLIGSGNAVGSFIQSKDKTGITDPKLAPLADNGGGNLTHALLNGSPAINNGSNTSLPADTSDLDGDGDVTELLPIDQLGNARIQYDTVDIGAVESNTIYGDDNNNLLKGTALSDKINGLGGNDTIKGREGNDSLSGGIGQDKLYGDKGKDLLTGGGDNDILVGGKGKDNFLYATGQAFSTADVGIDTLSDFTIKDDKIVLSKTTFTAILSSSGKGFSVTSDFALVSSDTQSATSSAHIVYNRSSGKLFYNENGEGEGFGTGSQFATFTKKPNISANNFSITA